jgi:hypothetical protein
MVYFMALLKAELWFERWLYSRCMSGRFGMVGRDFAYCVLYRRFMECCRVSCLSLVGGLRDFDFGFTVCGSAQLSFSNFIATSTHCTEFALANESTDSVRM